MFSNRKKYVKLNGRKSMKDTIKNGLPQGSALEPLLFNIYSNNMPETCSRGFLDKLQEYYRKWWPHLNPFKSGVHAFHLSNTLANKNLKVLSDGNLLRHNPNPKYLEATIDRSLTFENYLTKLLKN